MLRRMARLSRNQLHLPSALRRLGDSIAEPFSFWGVSPLSRNRSTGSAGILPAFFRPTHRKRDPDLRFWLTLSRT
jgi:hypothetical protein